MKLLLIFFDIIKLWVCLFKVNFRAIHRSVFKLKLYDILDLIYNIPDKMLKLLKLENG